MKTALDDWTVEEQVSFFRTGGLHAVLPLEERLEKPWDGDWYEGDSDSYRDDLYDGMSQPSNPANLQAWAVEWLEELAREGYRGRFYFYDHKSGKILNFPVKQGTSSGAMPKPLRVD